MIKYYIVQRRITKNMGWVDYWNDTDLKVAKVMVRKLREKYREEFRLIKVMKI